MLNQLKMSTRLGLLSGLAGVLMIVVGLSGINRLQALDAKWIEYQDIIAAKQAHVNQLRHLMGYGGGIHDFSHYLIRKQHQYYDDFLLTHAKAKEYILEYYELGEVRGLTDVEKSNLIKISELMDEYRRGINLARDMINDNANVQAIDKAIRIDDNSYLDAFINLQQELNKQAKEHKAFVINARDNGVFAISLLLVIFTIVFTLLAWWVIARITRPINEAGSMIYSIVEEKNLSLQLPVFIDKELGLLTGQFSAFQGRINYIFSLVQKAAQSLNSHAYDVAGWMTKNKEVAEKTSEQLRDTEQSMGQMDMLSGQLSELTYSQRESAVLAQLVAQNLKESMFQAIDAVSQYQERIAVSVGFLTEFDNSFKEIQQASRKQEKNLVDADQSIGQMNELYDDMSQSISLAKEKTPALIQMFEYKHELHESQQQLLSKIRDSFAHIQEVLESVSELAEQARMVSLNAGLEAAHADREQTASYQTVADELNRLSQRMALTGYEFSSMFKDHEKQIEDMSELLNCALESHGMIEKETKGNLQRMTEDYASVEKIIVAANEVKNLLADLTVSVHKTSDLVEIQTQSCSENQGILSSMSELCRKAGEISEKANGDAESIVDEMEGIVASAEKAGDLSKEQARRAKLVAEDVKNSSQLLNGMIQSTADAAKISNDLNKISQVLSQQVQPYKLG